MPVAVDDDVPGAFPHHRRSGPSHCCEEAFASRAGEGAAEAHRSDRAKTQCLPAGDRAPGNGCRPLGRACRDGRPPRTAARDPTRLQGHLRNRRCAHHSPVPHPCRERTAAGRRNGTTPGSGWRRHAGQAGNPRIRRRWTGLRPALAAGTQSLGHPALHRWFQFRVRRRCGRRTGAGRAWLRYRRLDPAAGGLLRHCRPETNAWSGIAARHHPAGTEPRHRRPDGLDSTGLRHPARCARRPRPARPRLSPGTAGVVCRGNCPAAARPSDRAAAAVLRARRAGLSRDAANDEPRRRHAAQSRLPGGGCDAAIRPRISMRLAA